MNWSCYNGGLETCKINILGSLKEKEPNFFGSFSFYKCRVNIDWNFRHSRKSEVYNLTPFLRNYCFFVSPLYCWRNTGEKFKIYPYAEMRNIIFNLLPMWRSQVGGMVEI